jgi:hypothetical protein
MRLRSAAFASICALAWIADAQPAWATNCAIPNSTCINDDVLWPHAGPAHFVAVGSTETVAAGQIGFGLVTSYISRPIVLQVPSPGSGGSPEYAINDQVNATFLWAYGATDRLELDLALPLTLGQGGTGLAPISGGAGINDTAMRDLRFGFAYVLVPHGRPGAAAPVQPIGASLGQRDGFGLIARFEMSAPTGDHDQFAGERTAVYVPSLAADIRSGPWFLGAEVGARLRPITELLGARVGNQIVAMLGTGFDILPRELLTATLEAWALPTLASQETGAGNPALVPAEWQLSARTSPLKNDSLSIQLGGGTDIPFGSDTEITRPRFRVSLAVRWAPLSR